MRIFDIALALQAFARLSPVSGSTPNLSQSLVEATRMGSIDMVARLIHEGADLNEGVNGWTPLHEAARVGNLEIVELMLSRGSDSRIACNGRFIPILVAAKHGHTHIVKRLADHNYDSLSKTMIFAAFNGRSDIVAYLLARDPNLANARNDGRFLASELSVDGDDLRYFSRSSSALDMAVKNGHLGVVTQLVQHGARMTPLLFDAACSGGHIAIVSFLIDNGAEVEPAGVSTPYLPISSAIESNKLDVVELLLKRGATRGLNHHLLHSGRNIPLTKLLLEHGADPNIASRNAYLSRLWFAVKDDELEIARLLLDHGADLGSGNGPNPLWTAVVESKFHFIDLFVEAGLVKDLNIPPFVDDREILFRLILGGAKNTLMLQEMMQPITLIKSAVSDASMRMYNQIYPALQAQGYTYEQGLIAFAFEARKGGVDLFNDDRPQEWAEERTRMVSSIIVELVYVGCTDVSFFYSVSPFLASADEGMLKHAETAYRFLAGSLGNPQEKEKHRSAYGAILNEMIQRSSHVGLRPVVKALFKLYHEEWKVKRILQSWGFAKDPQDPTTIRGLPEGVLDLVMGHDNGSVNHNFEAKAMRELSQAIRRTH